MSFEYLFREERKAGRAEGRAEGMAESIIELLSIKGLADDDINSQIKSVTDTDKLTTILKTAVLATSSDEIRNILA